jgi:ethanolamine ammonia-lyase small subunit
VSDDLPAAIIPATPSLEYLRRFTAARVALGRAGAGLPTKAHLQFTLDHARARDAVWSAVDMPTLEAALRERGLATARVRSQAGDRATYVRRPDLGRALAPDDLVGLKALGTARIAIVIADGLSAAAIEANALAVVDALRSSLVIDAVVLAEQGRVAIGDPIGAALGADLVIVLIGERPGLSAADSLGCYITYKPAPGTPDSKRNCVSNIRQGGLEIADAAYKIAWLAREALQRELTGIELKEESGAALEAESRAAIL